MFTSLNDDRRAEDVKGLQLHKMIPKQRNTFEILFIICPFFKVGEKGWLFNETRILVEELGVILTVSGDTPWMNRLVSGKDSDASCLTGAGLWIRDPPDADNLHKNELFTDDKYNFANRLELSQCYDDKVSLYLISPPVQKFLPFFYQAGNDYFVS